MIYLKNNTETQAIYIPRQTVLGGGYIATTEKYEEGYNDGFEDGKKQQKDKLSNLNVTENGQYEREDGWDVVTVNVPDLNGSYDEGYAEGERVGYNQGKTDGIDEQKSKLESINITENGTYTKEDGYNHIEVNVPDLNGSYDEGYEQGKTDGISEQKSKLEHIEITENGTYTKEDGYNHIEVNVIPKINIQEAGINFAYSTFTEVPEWADFKGTTSMRNMFADCSNLQTIPLIDTSNVTDMSWMFDNCSNLQTIPLIDTSNVTSMRNMFSNCTNLQTIPQLNTSNVTNIFSMFMDCYNLQTISPIDTSKATSMNRMFNGCTNLRALPEFDASNLYEINDYFGYSNCNYLTDVGGWKNLKCKWNDNYGLAKCPNLTYQSCINILNGLYDFVGNGESTRRTLAVHQNFLDKVGDKISIATNKGWTVEI